LRYQKNIRIFALQKSINTGIETYGKAFLFTQSRKEFH